MKAINYKATFVWLVCIFFSSITYAQPESKTNFIDSLGRKQGFWKKYSKDTLKYEGQFKDDKPYGEFKYYYNDGRIKALTDYSDNGSVAKTILYYPDGKTNAEGTYLDQKKDSLWIYYGTNGVKIGEENYDHGIKSGVWKFYYSNGAINKMEYYKNNMRDGESTEFYQEDSIIKSKYNYSNDKLNGVVHYFGLNGKIILAGKYINDLKEGEWMFFNDLGAGERKLTYKASKLIKEEVVFPAKGANKYINVRDIAFCEGQGKETIIRLNAGDIIETTLTLDAVERLLGEVNYFRVNSNFIVSFWSVKNRKTFDKDNPVLTLNPDPGKAVSVANEYMSGFMSWADLIHYDK